MKGLLFKDLVNIRQQARIYTLILAIWILIGITEKNLSFFGGVMSIFSAMVPLTACGYDEKANWDKYALTMPVTRKQLVISKYLLGILILLCGFGLMLLAGLFTDTALTEQIDIICVFGALGMTCMALMLPAVFRLGVEKARTVMMLIFIIPTVVLLAVDRLDLATPDPEMLRTLLHMAPAAAAVLFLLSIPFSIYLYEKREF